MLLTFPWLSILQACEENPWAGQNMPACLSLVAKMSLPGGQVLAARPAAICNALKSCNPSCKVANPAATAADAPLEALDSCTGTGIVAPAERAEVAAAGNTCSTNAECTAENTKCDFSSGVTAVCTCDSATGLDTK